MSFPRRRIEEVAAHYRLAKKALADIYVEGLNDKLLLDWYFKRAKPGVSVYSVDTVEIPDALLVAQNLDPRSARNRVRIMAQELDARLPPNKSPRFIIDRDQHDLVPIAPLPQTVCVTDKGTLELSFLTDESFEKLCAIVCKGKVPPTSAKPVALKIAFQVGVLRSAAKRLGLPVRFLDPADDIKIEKGEVCFAVDRYVERVLLSSNLNAHRARFVEVVEDLFNLVSAMRLDQQLLVNDHDLYKILRGVCRHYTNEGARSADQLRELMIMSASPTGLEGGALAQWLDTEFVGRV